MNFIRYCAVSLVLTIAAIAGGQTKSPHVAVGYEIAGTVVARFTGQPLGNATVVISPVNDRQSLVSFRTGSDGRFVFSGLAVGKYSLGAKRHGYVLQGFEQHEMFATAIAVGPGLDSNHLVFRLRPDGAIRGTITDEQNEPVSGINVHLYRMGLADGENTVREFSPTTTDDRGQYAFPHLEDGIYYVAASGRPWYSNSYGYVQESRIENKDPEVKARLKQEGEKLDLVFPLTFYSGTLSSDDATQIRLEAGQAATADFTLQAVRSVHVRIVGMAVAEPSEVSEAPAQETGTLHLNTGIQPGPAGPPRVRITRDIFGGKVEDDATTMGVFEGDAGGAYEVSGFPPGRYLMMIDHPADPSAPSSYQEIDLSGDMDVTPAKGAPSGKVSGTVWLDGKPAEKAFIELRAVGSSRGYGGQIKKGDFQFEDTVLPGQYQVSIGTNTNNYVYVGAMSAVGAKVIGRTIQVGSGAQVKLAIVASSGVAQINGVAKLSGKPKAGVMILLAPDDLSNNPGLVRRDQSDSDGTFTLRDVAPGRYKLLAIEHGWSLQWADPKALQPFLANARTLLVEQNQKLQTTVDVQSAK